MASLRDFNLYDGDIPRFVSYGAKISNDFSRVKDIIDRMDLWYGDYRDNSTIEKFKMNYDLYNGRLDTRLYDDPICFNLGGEEIKLGHEQVNHYPIISQIANAMHGEMISRPFRPVAKHTGTYAHTMRTKQWNTLIRQMISDRILQPMQERVAQQYLKQYGVSDPRGLSPEQIQQAQADISRRVQEQTPREIMDFMENDYQTPTERHAQLMLDYLVERYDIKAIQDEGFKDAIITGTEVYYVGDRHGDPFVEKLNPIYFNCGGSQNVEYFQNMDWAKYEQWISFEKAVQDYTDVFSKDDYNLLEQLAEPIGGYGRARADWYKRDPVYKRATYELSVNDGYYLQKYGSVDIKTKAGQSKLSRIYGEIMEKYGTDYGHAFSRFGIREVRFAYMDKRKLKVVTRIENDRKVDYYLDEHYEPTDRDVEVKDLWINEVWEATKLGTGEDCQYVKIRPTPGQFKSIFNPYDVELPFYGKRYATHSNNSESVAPVDMAKSWQLEFDITMAQLKQDMATDIGKVFVMLMNLKPDNMTWQDWLNTMKNTKLLMATANKHGISGIDPQIMRSFDMGRGAEIANKVQLLEFLRNNIIAGMFFNPSRIGAIGEYATTQNTVQNQSASYNQTEALFETHRLIIEKMLSGLMNRTKFVYRNQPEKVARILGDLEALDAELSKHVWYEEMNIKFSTSTADLDTVRQLKGETMTFIQNQMSFEGVLELALAKTPSDVISLFRKEGRRLERQRQEAIQLQQQQAEAERQSKLQEKQIEAETDIIKNRETLASQERRALWGVEQFRIQGDVDNNKRADSIQIKEMDLEFEREKLNLDAVDKAKKAAQKDRELDIKSEEVKSKNRNNG